MCYLKHARIDYERHAASLCLTRTHIWFLFCSGMLEICRSPSNDLSVLLPRWVCDLCRLNWGDERGDYSKDKTTWECVIWECVIWDLPVAERVWKVPVTWVCGTWGTGWWVTMRWLHFCCLTLQWCSAAAVPSSTTWSGGKGGNKHYFSSRTYIYIQIFRWNMIKGRNTKLKNKLQSFFYFSRTQKHLYYPGIPYFKIKNSPNLLVLSLGVKMPQRGWSTRAGLNRVL